MKKGLGIRGKLLVGILPFVLVALVALTLISAFSARSVIIEQINDNMKSELTANAKDINDRLNEMGVSAKDIATTMGHTFGKLDLTTDLRELIVQLIESNEIINACALWFEPGVMPQSNNFAPYFHKEGDKLVEKDVGGDGSYRQEEFYTFCKSQKSLAVMYTDPVYSEVSQNYVIRAAAPIFQSGTGKFMGAVTVVVTLDQFRELVSEIDFGDNADVAVCSKDGTYIYSANQERVDNRENITDMADGLGPAAASLLGEHDGYILYNGSDDSYHLYNTTIDNTGWKLITRIANSVVNAPVTRLIWILVVVCAIAVIVCVAMIFIQAGSMAKAVRVVEEFADEIANGNFTIDKINTKRRDELGTMSHTLNVMYDNNKEMIGQIASNSNHVNSSSEGLHEIAQELNVRFGDIRDNMAKVNDAMMSSSAATQEVSASVNEVNASVQKLSDETTRTDDHVKEIGDRARGIQEHSSAAFANAKDIYNQRSQELNAASKKAEVVNEIGNLASAIADIADQINLLSLNASIEAARAGEHGKGFAVVASEINKLASETQEAVTQIQTTIDAVQDAFGDLSKSANDLLVFVNETVTPDYESFVEVGEQYGKDAASFAELTADIMEMIGFIRESMDQVNAAVTNIAESTQDTASSSSEITETVTEVNDMVGNIGDMVKDQSGVAKDLHEIVTQYRLE